MFQVEMKTLELATAPQKEFNLKTNIMITCPCNVHPLLYSKTGVYRGIHYFLIFALKHRLWVLAKTASVLTCTNNLCFEKNIKIVKTFQPKIVNLQP